MLSDDLPSICFQNGHGRGLDFRQHVKTLRTTTAERDPDGRTGHGRPRLTGVEPMTWAIDLPDSNGLQVLPDAGRKPALLNPASYLDCQSLGKLRDLGEASDAVFQPYLQSVRVSDLRPNLRRCCQGRCRQGLSSSESPRKCRSRGVGGPMKRMVPQRSSRPGHLSP